MAYTVAEQRVRELEKEQPNNPHHTNVIMKKNSVIEWWEKKKAQTERRIVKTRAENIRAVFRFIRTDKRKNIKVLKNICYNLYNKQKDFVKSYE